MPITTQKRNQYDAIYCSLMNADGQRKAKNEEVNTTVPVWLDHRGVWVMNVAVLDPAMLTKR